VTELGNWIKNLPPLRVALGLLLLLVSASFSLGAATTNLSRMPADIEAGKIKDALQDSVMRRQETVLNDFGELLLHHIEQDSTATAGIRCVIQAIYEGRQLRPFECPSTDNPR
jgi:hypothetical protein